MAWRLANRYIGRFADINHRADNALYINNIYIYIQTIYSYIDDDS